MPWAHTTQSSYLGICSIFLIRKFHSIQTSTRKWGFVYLLEANFLTLCWKTRKHQKSNPSLHLSSSWSNTNFLKRGRTFNYGEHLLHQAIPLAIDTIYWWKISSIHSRLKDNQRSPQNSRQIFWQKRIIVRIFNFRIGFNSFKACSSVNHLHF